MRGPDSVYSAFVTHIWWKVSRSESMEPPMKTECLRSSGYSTRMRTVDGASSTNSFCILLPNPGNIVVPPESTTLLKRSFRRSMSQFMMESKTCRCMPLASMPMSGGLKAASGHRKRSLPRVTICPSGSSYVTSTSELVLAFALSDSKFSETKQHFSLMSRTISFSPEVVSAGPRSDMIFMRYSVRSRPAKFARETAWGMA
mmetsp:Transcript_11555/g.36058  ORF Transcript_11555/g.36058 Transcript_11555/m.36058 type:complete len:201 (+) Transcript_11555:169-771(+)